MSRSFTPLHSSKRTKDADSNRSLGDCWLSHSHQQKNFHPNKIAFTIYCQARSRTKTYKLEKKLEILMNHEVPQVFGLATEATYLFLLGKVHELFTHFPLQHLNFELRKDSH